MNGVGTPEVSSGLCGMFRQANIRDLVAEHAERALLTELIRRRSRDWWISAIAAPTTTWTCTRFWSARAIVEWFPQFFDIGYSCAAHPARESLAKVRPAGVACESAMSRTTAGDNTHKGAILSLGLLSA